MARALIGSGHCQPVRLDYYGQVDYVRAMKQASVAELKARLSEYLAAVKRGEDVIVTDRGKPVAKLTPLEKGAGRDARVMELLRAGLMSPPRKRLPRTFLERSLPTVADGAVADAIRKERDEGW